MDNQAECESSGNCNASSQSVASVSTREAGAGNGSKCAALMQATTSMVERIFSLEDGDPNQETRHSVAITKSVKFYTESVATPWQQVNSTADTQFSCQTMAMDNVDASSVTMEVPRKGDVITKVRMDMKTCGVANTVYNNNSDGCCVLLTQGSFGRILGPQEVAEITTQKVIRKICDRCPNLDSSRTAMVADAVGCKYDPHDTRAERALDSMDPMLLGALQDDENSRFTPYIADTFGSAYACSKREPMFQLQKLDVYLGSKNKVHTLSSDVLYCMIACSLDTCPGEQQVFTPVSPSPARYEKANYDQHVYESRFSELMKMPIPLQMFAAVDLTAAGELIEQGWKHGCATFHTLQFQVHLAKPQLSVSNFRSYGSGRMKNVAYCGLYLKPGIDVTDISQLTTDDLLLDDTDNYVAAILPINTVVVPSSSNNIAYSELEGMLWNRATGVRSTLIARTRVDLYGMPNQMDAPRASYSNLRTTSYRLASVANYLPSSEAELYTDKQIEEACLTYLTNQVVLCASNASNNSLRQRGGSALDAVAQCSQTCNSFQSQMDDMTQRRFGNAVEASDIGTNNIVSYRGLEYKIDVQTEKCARGLLVYTQHDATMCHSTKFGFTLPVSKRKLLHNDNAVGNGITLFMPSMKIQLAPVFGTNLGKEADNLLAIGLELNGIPMYNGDNSSGYLTTQQLRTVTGDTRSKPLTDHSRYIAEMAPGCLKGGAPFRSFGTPMNFSRLEHAVIRVMVDSYMFSDMRVSPDGNDNAALVAPDRGENSTMLKKPFGEDDDALCDVSLLNSSLTFTTLTVCNNVQRSVYGLMGLAVAAS